MRPFQNLRTQQRATCAGFTLIEIMLVVGIITVLMGSAIFMLTGNLEYAKITRAETDVSSLSGQVQTYELRFGSIPDSLKALTTSKPRLLEEVPKDPWGKEYGIKKDATSTKRFRIVSTGPDQAEGGGDDILSK
jgi:general secretion pathway protein G